jgi:DNA-binding transcriptional LysR family regulator
MPNLGNNATNADSLSLDHMRAFIAVVETGSQVRAGKRLGVAQTTVCRQIERVQEHFGGGLFEAGASGPLSTRGLLVEQSVRAAMAELSRTRDRLAVDSPVLRIGFIRLMRPLVERALRGQLKAHGIPAFEVRLLELPSEVQARALARREIDVAICYALPEFAKREGIEESVLTDQPYALAIPERGWVRGKPSVEVLGSLIYAHLPRRPSSRVAQAEEQWLSENGLAPARSVECGLGTEILAYAGAGHGYGFLPALWSTASHEGVVFAPVLTSAPIARIAAYSLKHVAPWMAQLRENLSAATRAALEDVSTIKGRRDR